MRLILNDGTFINFHNFSKCNLTLNQSKIMDGNSPAHASIFPSIIVKFAMRMNPTQTNMSLEKNEAILAFYYLSYVSS
jgi:hypothetical protein